MQWCWYLSMFGQIPPTHGSWYFVMKYIDKKGFVLYLIYITLFLIYIFLSLKGACKYYISTLGGGV